MPGMMSGYRVSEAVIVPARTAALLAKLLDLDRRRVEWRGSDAEVDAVLVAWREVALSFTASQLNDRDCVAGFTPETAGGTAETDRIQAARERRLDGRQVAGRWTFTRAAVDGDEVQGLGASPSAPTSL